MLISPFQMPIRTDGGPSSNFLQDNVQITNLETVELTFRFRFSSSVAWPVPQIKTGLDAHVHITGVIDGQSKKWSASGNTISIEGDHKLAAGRTTTVMLYGQGPILDNLQNMQPFLADGLQGTTWITLPVVSAPVGRLRPTPSAQLDHPARVLISAFLKPAGYSGPRSFFPLVGGSPEFQIPPDQPRGTVAKRAAPKRKLGPGVGRGAGSVGAKGEA